MTHVNRALAVGLTAFLVLAVGGCTSSSTGTSPRLVDTWRDPGQASQPLNFRKIAVFVRHEDLAIRDKSEDEVVRHMGANIATAAHTIVTDEQRKDPTALRAHLESLGFDGAVGLMPVASSERTKHVVDASGSSFELAMSGPITEEVQTLVSIQASIYSIKTGNVVWSGVTSAVRSQDLASMVDEVARQVGRELRKEGFIE